MSNDRLEEKMDTCLANQTGMIVDISRNTQDLSHHIKRTNIIESKLQKMIYLLLIGAGIGLALYGPDALKLLKVIL